MTTSELLNTTYSAYEALQAPQSPVLPTRLTHDPELSSRYEADIWLASELHQVIRAYKIRGGYNFMRQQDQGSRIVSSSAGNHSQAVAVCANTLGMKADIFMPQTTPQQKVDRARELGGTALTLHLTGSSFDEANQAAQEYCQRVGGTYAHPFDNELVIAGQGTLGVEVLERGPQFDAVLCPVGGGGLVSGVGTVLKAHNRATQIIGVEPAGAASMTHALEKGTATPLSTLDSFVDGASVGRVGALTLACAQAMELQMERVDNDQARRAITELWERGIRAELAGGIAVSGLEEVADQIRGSRVLCIVSGGNLSQSRFDAEVKWVPSLASANSPSS